jgi:hypothetical protein
MDSSMFEPFHLLKRQALEVLAPKNWQPDSEQQVENGNVGLNLYEPNQVCLPSYDDDEPIVVDQPMNLGVDTEPLALGPYPSDLPQVCSKPNINYQHVNPQVPSRNVSDREYSLGSYNMQLGNRNSVDRDYSVGSVMPPISQRRTSDHGFSTDSVGSEYSSHQFSANDNFAASTLSSLNRSNDVEFTATQPTLMSMQPTSVQTMALQLPSHSGMALQSGNVSNRMSSMYSTTMQSNSMQAQLMQPMSSSRGYAGLLQQTSALASEYVGADGLEWRNDNLFNDQPLNNNPADSYW